MSGSIHFTRPGAHVALVRIDNPPTNALGDAVRAALLAHLEEAERDLSIRAVVLTGEGRAFCSGDDLREVAARDAATMRASLDQFARLYDLLERFRCPVIAAIDGPAMGGGLELALACDIRLATPEARFAAAGVNVGLMASVRRLPRLIGVARAKAMLLTGRPIDGETALSWGLVTELHEAPALREAALDLAAHIASRAPLSVEAAKRHAGLAYDMDAAEAGAAQAGDLATLMSSADHRAAVAAFLEKRKPVFTRS